jgi:glycosyltransferase involved in cell wall biosynthesis
MESILAQTFTDWELIISDNYSDDGSWDYLQTFQKNPRVRLFQFPRAGMYANWNNCIRLARGEFIYIATSDDTMTPDCLEKMIAALDRHPVGDIAHCCLNIIDEQGRSLGAASPWLQYRSTRYFNDWNWLPHVRYAPHDGLLHFIGGSVYTSITQLLIRRGVFDRIGLFDRHFGSYGDFEWNMRASLLVNTIHVPEALATWRLHPAQATGGTDTARCRRIMGQMTMTAVRRARRLDASLRGSVPMRRLRLVIDWDYIWFGLRERRSALRRILFLVCQGMVRPWIVRQYIKRGVSLPFDVLDSVSWIRDELKGLGVRSPELVDDDPPNADLHPHSCPQETSTMERGSEH